MKTHWLYGHGEDKIVTFNVEIDEEHKCHECIHRAVCKRNMWDFCSNFKFGTSNGKECECCINHFTRWDKDPIPCFHCKHYMNIE